MRGITSHNRDALKAMCCESMHSENGEEKINVYVLKPLLCYREWLGPPSLGGPKPGMGAVYTTEECVFTITTTITSGWEGNGIRDEVSPAIAIER
jgi:hypothetical protein